MSSQAAANTVTLDSILSTLALLVPPARLPLAQAFTRAYYAHLLAEDLALRPSAEWAAIAASHGMEIAARG